ncbi:MAG: zinc dependent phospholipase C family protein [SAR202 cluster bacterium]|nr:zinc dependent phospholipase C family protein [SAR202 cluster bacterium]
MPNLATHFNFALRTLEALQDPMVEAHKGSFLLGCTTPDIRAVTKWKRDYTHFTPLEVEGVGDGTAGMFIANPRLKEAMRRSPATRAFIAGYISHLTTDETWITHVYQPHFGNREEFPSEVEANVSDRALQLDLDRQAWEEVLSIESVLDMLNGSDDGVSIGFIDSPTLAQWRAWVVDFGRRPFSWGRLSFLVRRMYKEDQEAQMVVESFLSGLYTNLNRVYSRVPKKRIKEFNEKSVSESVRLIKENLGEAPLA